MPLNDAQKAAALADRNAMTAVTIRGGGRYNEISSITIGSHTIRRDEGLAPGDVKFYVDIVVVERGRERWTNRNYVGISHPDHGKWIQIDEDET